MEYPEEHDSSQGFELVLKELIGLHEEANLSKDSNHRSGFNRVLKELMAEREKAAVTSALMKQQNELMAEREKAAVATALLKQQDETALILAKQQNEMMRQLQKQQDEFQAKLEEERREHSMKQDKLLARQDELLSRQDQERKEERRRQDQERRDALQQQERQQNFFREVIQQLQDEVKVLRHSEGAHLISGTQGEVETPGKHRTTASTSPYSMTPLSLMMETPNKPFEDSIGSEVVENFAAGESGSVDETNNYVGNDAVEEEEPTKITKSDQGSVILSDEDLRAKGLISSEETFLLNKSDQVGNKVENEKGKKLPKITKNKSRALRDAKETMKMIGGKQTLIVVLFCGEMATLVHQKVFFVLRTITLHLDLANLYYSQFACRQSIDK